MARKPIDRNTNRKTNRNVNKPAKQIIPEKYQDLFYISILIVSLLIFFGGAIFGNGFNASDNIASTSFHPYLEAARKSGNFPLWMPYIFGGMPSYGSLLTTGTRVWDVVPGLLFGFSDFVGSVFGNDSGRIAFFYMIYAVGIYLLMRSKKHERFVAFFTSFAATFSTGVLIWIMIGHNTKPVVFSMIPFVFMFVEKLRDRFSLLYSVLLIFAIHIMLEAGHIQLIFYSVCALGLYLLFEFFSRLIAKKGAMKIVKVAAILAVAGGIAFLMSSDRYLATLEYTDYSTRGSAPIVKTDANKQDAHGGNDYNYATQWSFSPEEIITFFVPNYFGFGKLKYDGRAVRKPTKLPTYWGQKPFEDTAPYMGIIILALAIVGSIANRKVVFVQFLVALSLFALLLSFGYTLPVLYDFFYYNVPSFNKFRAPSMVLVLMQFAVPVLAGYGLASVIKWRREYIENKSGINKSTINKSTINKYLKGIIIGSGAFLVLGFLFNIFFESAYIDALKETANQSYAYYSGQIADLNKFVFSAMISDWYVTGLIAFASAILIFMFVKNKLGKGAFFAAIFLLLVIDLWRVGYRPMEVSEKSIEQSIFPRTDVINYIYKDKSIFRIADFASASPNVAAYFLLENINGYHSAKLRVLQDLLDVTSGGSTSNVTSPFVWNLMNAKYIIYPQELKLPGLEPVFRSQQTGAFVYLNRNMLPRSLFVNRVEVAKPMDILTNIRDGRFNPRDVAFVESELPIKIDTLREGASSIVMVHKNEYIKVKAKATGNNLLLISEMYYPAGWKAYIDGKQTPIYKTNYAFRSVIVPKGEHIVEFKFTSAGFETGRTLSIAANIVTVLALIFGIFLERKRNAG